MEYATTTDVFGVNRFPGIKRRPIYSSWPLANQYIAATLWEANEEGAQDLKCKIGKATQYKDILKPTAKTRMQTVIDDQYKRIQMYKEENKGRNTKECGEDDSRKNRC